MLTTEARKRLEEAVSLNPGRPRVTVRRPDLHELLRTLAEAMATLEAGADAPEGPRLGYWLGIVVMVVLFIAAGVGGYLLHS